MPSPNDELTVPQIKAQYHLPFCRRTIQKLIETDPAARIMGRRETIPDHRRYRTMFIVRKAWEKILRDMAVTGQ
ncbi:MAG: hypothetical protein WA383_00680 [Terriglobales bacterium]